MSRRRHWITRANALSFVRVIAAPLLAIAIGRDAALVATLLFCIAVASDLGDGWLARRLGETSPLGGFIDHAADALFVTAGTAALACTGALPAPLPFLIAAAFVQYTLDSRSVATRGLRPSRLGRGNGIAYYVIVAVPIVRDALGLAWPPAGVVTVLGWLLVASTVASMVDRLRLLLAR